MAEAKANRGLQVEFRGRLGLSQSANELPAAYRRLKDYETVGLTMTIPIYDWGMGRGKVRMAKTDVEITKTQIEQANIEFAHDVRTKVLQFNNQAEQCKTSLRAQDIAAERYDIMKKRVRERVGDGDGAEHGARRSLKAHSTSTSVNCNSSGRTITAYRS